MPTQEPRADKLYSAMTDARLAVKQAERYIQSYPASTATPVVKNLKLALNNLLGQVSI